MQLSFRLRSVTSNSGDKVRLPHAGVTCVVGGNNVGKSQLLRDIDAYLGTPESTPVTLSDIGVDKDPKRIDESVEPWLSSISNKHGEGLEQPFQYSPLQGGGSGQIGAHNFVNHWNNGQTLKYIHRFFCWHGTAGSLGGSVSGSISTEQFQRGGSPLAQVFRNGDLDRQLSELSAEAFGFPLTFDRITGDFCYRIGAPDVDSPPIDQLNAEYLGSVERLQKLERQGDGIKSFLGLALNVIAGSSQLILVDEPEAFLHPAQCRTLGRWLGSQALAADRQVIVATHDRDFVLGLLNSGAPIKIVRIERDGNKTRLRQLEPDIVADLWADPVLRYSNVLQGLFHQRVVVCESDADCRYYGAVLDELATETKRRSIADDTLFVPSGGKQRIATLVTALAQIGVAAHAIVDFDIYDKKAEVKKLVQANGQQWTAEMNSEYATFADHANQNKLWGKLKNGGLHGGALRGEPFEAATCLTDTLREHRIHVVPVGEMEDLDRSISSHGGDWVSTMLEKGGHKTNVVARKLVGAILDM